jgi:hypothetical protein
MSPLPAAVKVEENGRHLSKRINLNPFQPLKNNWDKVGPSLDKYNKHARIVQVLLGGISLIALLDAKNWKLPRWPWAKDGKNNPAPTIDHPNMRMTVDELVEKKLMEALLEMKMHEDIPLESTISAESEGEIIKGANEQFLKDPGGGIEDVLEEMREEGNLI